MNFVIAVLFSIGAIYWAIAGNAPLAALMGLVAGIWWSNFVVEVSH